MESALWIPSLKCVPRFILSSTDHCKIALIVSKHRQRERTLKFQSSSFFFIYFLIGVDIKMEKSKDNRFVIIVKIEKYIEYMLTILLKLPRTEKFSIGTEVKTSMYEMMKNILLESKIDKNKRLSIYNIICWNRRKRNA